jgi:DNA-binding CsgD family transcriptional regulator
MLAPQRRRLAGEALDELLGSSEWGSSDLLELAAHLAVHAGRLADAARYLTEDARRALASGASATAIATARRARDLLPRDAPDAIAAAQVLLSALSQAGDIVGVDEVGGELLRANDAMPGASERARILLPLARAAHARLDLSRARNLCEEAVALGPADDRLRVELDLMLAEVSFSEHRQAAAVAGAERVLADADAAGFADLARDALELIGRYRMFISFELLEAEPYLLEAVRRAEAAGLPLSRLRVLERLAFHDLTRGRGRARMEEGRASALELGALGLAVAFDHVLGTHHLIADELELATTCAERALADARRYGLRELTVLLLGLLATISAVRGERSVAERQAREAVAAAEGLPLMRPAVSGTTLVVAALADDDLAPAADRVSEVRALLPDEIVFWPPFLGSFYGVASVVAAVTGIGELVEGRDWVRVDDIYQHSSFCIARAIIAGRAGDREQAVALFAEGDDGLRAVPWARATYRRYAGEAALVDGWGDPARWLAEAEVYLGDRGNEPLARACRSLLRLAGTSPRRHRAGSEDGRYAGLELTTREADVLALLADGLTNKEIAGRLYLSPRTVEKHVERILAKTGQANRTALAAFATERAPVAPAT